MLKVCSKGGSESKSYGSTNIEVFVYIQTNIHTRMVLTTDGSIDACHEVHLDQIHAGNQSPHNSLGSFPLSTQ